MRASAILLALAICGPGTAADTPFAGLTRLAGNWQAQVGARGAVVRVNVRAVSNGSAVVETFTTPSGRETLTIFHPDGGRVLATHYCAQGNQPRLVLDPKSTAAEMTFRFLDATNLKSQGASHLVRLVFKIADDDGFEMTEVYASGGAEEVTVYSFARVR